MTITVNGEKIKKDIYEQELEKTRRENSDLKEEEIKELAIQSIVDWTILRQEAKTQIKRVTKKEIDEAFNELKESHGGEKQFYEKFELSDKDDAKIKRDISLNLKVQKLIKEIAKDAPKPTEKAIKSYYEEHKDMFINPEEIHAAHIVRQVDPSSAQNIYQEMLDIRQKLQNGGDFAEMANQFSSCQDEGGDLGYFPRGKMVEEFDVITFSMNVGEISPVFQTAFGYHIATVLDKKSESLKSMEEARPEIEDILNNQFGNEHIGAWVDDKKASAEIKIEE
jgi:parvulin-like peptidyl-prolyl isomerase